tara:strand:- start:518 stop:1153 length:636 start_codon:yes stop_codon:yes gene_type:complete
MIVEEINNNDISGWFGYKGVTTMQVPAINVPFKKLFNTIKPKRVLEIGTSSGGLTLMLRDILDDLELTECDFRTYDTNPDHDRTILFNSNLNYDFRLKNLFNQPYSDLCEKNGQEVIDYINEDGPIVILCDGGCKINEFNILSKFLKPGDIIMAHDYAPTVEYFESHNKNKIWNWCEIFDKDVTDACSNNNLTPYMADEFTAVVWLCCKKN